MQLFNREKKQKKLYKQAGLFVQIEWDNEAVDASFGADYLKIFNYYEDGYLIFQERYSESKYMELKRNHYFIRDVTKGEFVPKESQFVPSTHHVASVTQIYRRI